MFQPETKVINDIEFKVIPFPATIALKLKVRLLKIIGPAFGRLLGSFEGVGENSLNAQIDGYQLASSLETLFSQLGEDEFIQLIKQLLNGVSCTVNNSENQPVFISFNDKDFDTKLDIVFQRKLFTIYPVIYFVLEVNYPDFFGKLAGIGSRIGTIMSKLGSGNTAI